MADGAVTDVSVQRFEPTNTIDMNKEKDWPSSIGMMDWDRTSIVFTKRSLIEFLKYDKERYTGMTVDTNFTNIVKLPRYAKFGKLTDITPESDSATGSAEALSQLSISDSKPEAEASETIASLISDGGADDDAASKPQPDEAKTTDLSVRPSRRVRTSPGGHDSISDLWGPKNAGDVFKPTRRVRQQPGGQDNLEGIL